VQATAQRRTAIRDILLSQEVRNQAELSQLLEGRGFSVSQPVLSRDLRALQVAKAGGVYQVLDAERVTPLGELKSLLRAVGQPRHLVLLHCEPGAASAVARALEAEEIPGVEGTIAGDDTILVAVSSETAASSVRRRIQELL